MLPVIGMPDSIKMRVEAAEACRAVVRACQAVIEASVALEVATEHAERLTQMVDQWDKAKVELHEQNRRARFSVVSQ